MSSGVMRSSRCVGRPSSRMMTSVQRVYSHTSGLKATNTLPMGPTTHIATRSGWAMLRRLGTRSAKTTNIDVTTATEPANARLVAVRGDSHWPSSASR